MLKMTPRVALFTGIYPPDTGGPAKFAETFANFLTEHQQDVMVYAYSGNIDQDTLYQGQNVRLIPIKLNIVRRYLKMVRLILNEVSSGSVIIVNGCFWEIAIARHIKKFNYLTKVPGDIVWERARNLNKTQSSVDEYNLEKQFHYKILRYLFTYSLVKSQITIVPSTHLKELCCKWGVSPSRIALIKNSVSTKIFAPDASVSKIYDFITVCRLVPWKGVEELIDFSAHLKSSLVIVGDGPERAKLELHAKKLNADVDFRGNLQQDQLPILLQQSRTFLLNSSFEATSYALLEAQSTALLVVANEMTGSEEVIEHGWNGLLCGARSGLTMLNAMDMSKQNALDVFAMGNRARANVQEHFNLEKNYAEILRMAKSI
jgi:glycosyltransferase involved in cell wall biosynthesis